MAKKKRVKKASKKGSKKDYKKNFRIVIRNLIIFSVLTILSIVLYFASGKEFLQNLFYLLGIVFGFIGLAFLLILLIFLFMKVIKRK